MLHFWRHILELGRQHGVDPLVFGVLYLAHHPLFWGTMALLTVRLRQKRPVRPLVALAAFFWLLPYLYIFAFGRHLPVWVYALVAIALAVGGAQALKQIRLRLTGSG